MRPSGPRRWDRARGGAPLFHDVALQRAYWQCGPTLEARKYVEQVFQAVAQKETTS